MYGYLTLVLPPCAVNSHHLSLDSSLVSGKADPDRESAGVSRKAGDEISKWKGVQSIEILCAGGFFSARSSCSGEKKSFSAVCC